MTFNQPQRGAMGTPARGTSTGAPAQPAPQVPGTLGQPVNRVDWFRRAPGGGTVFVKPSSEEQ